MASWSKQSKSGENPLKSCGEFLEKYQREGGGDGTSYGKGGEWTWPTHYSNEIRSHFGVLYSPTILREVVKNIARIANAVQCTMCCLGSTIAPYPKTEIQKPLSHGKKLFLRLFFLFSFRMKTLKLVSFFYFPALEMVKINGKSQT